MFLLDIRCLVACMSLFGSDIYGIDSIKFVQAILFAATVFLVFVLAYQITKKYSIGFIASALIALNGNYAFYTRRLLTEIFFVFTMMLFFVLFILSVQKEKKWLHFFSGMVFCISVFVRPLFFIVLPVLYLPHFIKNWKNWKKIFASPLAFFSRFFIGWTAMVDSEYCHTPPICISCHPDKSNICRLGKRSSRAGSTRSRQYDGEY